MFTAAKFPVAYIDEIPDKVPIDASEEIPVFSFATNGDGSAGTNFIIHTTPFYINLDRLAIRAIDPNILTRYIPIALRYMKEEYGFNHAHKANVTNISQVRMKIPVNDANEFDTDMQRNAIETNELYLELIESTKNSKEKVASFRPQTIVSECEVNKFSLSYLFDIQRGSGKYTKKYIQNHTGEYPLYSGNTYDGTK